MFELVDNTTLRDSAVIKVVGVGGGGGNALDYMVDNHIEGVEFISVNTDTQVLGKSKADVPVRIGTNLTGGLGAGCDPDVGRKAADEDRDKITEALQGADMVFIAAGMGGGTGTGAAPVIAEIARDSGSLAVAVVTKPFEAEGQQRMDVALSGIDEIERQVDSLIVIPNQKLITVLGKVSVLDAFSEANRVLHSAVQGIAELITRRGVINLDFADVRTVMCETGTAMIGAGHASGDNRAYEAAHAAIGNPLLDDVDLTNASGLLVNITAGPNLGLEEYNEVAQCMNGIASNKARMVIGMVIDEEMSDEVRVTLVATGLDSSPHTRAAPSRQAVPPSLTAEDGVVRGGDLDETAAEARQELTLSVADSDSEDFDTPAFMRQRRELNPTRGQHDLPEVNSEEEYLDIPAFLRRQVD